MSLDRKFEVLRPTYDRLVRVPLTVSNPLLVTPGSTSPLTLVDGELVSIAAGGKWNRAASATVPSHFVIDDRGDTGVQASKKLTAIQGGGGFLCNTVIFDAALVSRGVPVMYGVVALEGNRAGLIAHTGSNIVTGYIMKVAAENGGKLQVFVTFN